MLQFVKKDARYQIVTIVKQSAGREIWIRSDLRDGNLYIFFKKYMPEVFASMMAINGAKYNKSFITLKKVDENEIRKTAEAHGVNVVRKYDNYMHNF